ncbi:aspartyl-phosphate phosphatase Spo0E family protein [Paenibacillus melissococcoides]|nr:aspartyl-phosphate phosphatase Spo0E family protein [Paenibacillus melissococcoides]
MEIEIEKTRSEMHDLYDKFSLMSIEVLEISQRLDKLLNKYNKEKSRLQKQST